MGIDLIITKNDGEYVADLGRAHNFEVNGTLDTDYDKLDRDVQELKNEMVENVVLLKTFMEGKIDVLVSLVKEKYDKEFELEADYRFKQVEETIDDLSEELIKIGKKLLLSYILEEDHLTYRKDC